MNFLYWTLGCFVGLFLLVAVHEAGHFLAGWMGGIPLADMRIRLFTFPQHVALRGQGRWLSPNSDDFPEYLAKMQQCLPTSGRLFLYTAGGFLLETVAACAIVGLLLACGWLWPAQVVAVCSLWLFCSYVLMMDLPMTIKCGFPCGDLSGLWKIARIPAVLLAGGMLAVRLGLLWLAFSAPTG